jgi:DNA-binding NarL/FixJ family response regulator
VRVLLADDHALFRAGLASLFKAWGVEVVGEASNGNEAIAQARALKPDAIFMDIHMPECNGLEATRAIKAESPEMTIVMLTVSDDEQDLFEAIKSGAEGYLLKNLQEEEFAEMVGRVSRGEPALSPNLARGLMREFARLGSEGAPSDEADGLTERERDVLEYVAGGATNREIASALVISENTVNFHMRNILGKLHLRNRAQVVAWAIEHGITPADPP